MIYKNKRKPELKQREELNLRFPNIHFWFFRKGLIINSKIHTKKIIDKMKEFSQNLNNNNFTYAAALFPAILLMMISFGNRYYTLSFLIKRSKRNLNIIKWFKS